MLLTDDYNIFTFYQNMHEYFKLSKPLFFLILILYNKFNKNIFFLKKAHTLKIDDT